MLTKDDLSAIGNLIDEKIKPLKKGQEGLVKGMERIEKKLDQSIEDNAGFFNDAGIFFDEMRSKIVKRIQDIEDHLGIHKN